MNKNELFDDNMQVQTEGQLYSQNIYRSIRESIGCHFAIINIEFPGNNMIVFNKCKVANCQVRLKLSAVLIQSSSQIKFDVFRKGVFLSENHKNVPRQYISGKFRESLACKVVQQGALKRAIYFFQEIFHLTIIRTLRFAKIWRILEKWPLKSHPLRCFQPMMLMILLF